MQYNGTGGSECLPSLGTKVGGIGCEILCKKSKNAGTPPNNLVKIEISNFVKIEISNLVKIEISNLVKIKNYKIENCGIKILEFDFFQFFDYNKDRNFETGVE